MVLGHFYHKIYYYSFDNGDMIYFVSFLLKILLLCVGGFTAFFAGLPAVHCGTVDQHQECLVPVLKMCYSRYFSWFTDIGPAFKLNTGNLVTKCWAGICINRNGPMLEGLDYCCEKNTAKEGRAGVIVKEEKSSVLNEMPHCCRERNNKEWTQSW